jgi:hypothetical protein
MWLIDSLAEEQIQAAIRRGDLDRLPGQGRPLNLADDAGVPEHLRAGYRLLKNAGCLPPEMTLRREIRSLEALLGQIEADHEARPLRQRLGLLRTRLALRGRESSLLLQEDAYRRKLLCRLARDADETARADGHA